VRSGTGKRATFDPADDLNPAWSPDGRRIAFTSTRGGGRDLYATAIDGAGADSGVWASAEEKSLEDWSADGQSLVFNDAAGHLQAFRFSDRTVMRLTDGPGIQVEARLSPNGRWLAYRSIEGGRSEIFVESFPPGAGRWQVSTGGGAEPAWRADGRELFFLIENKLMAVETETRAEAFRAGIPKELFVVRGLSSQFRNRYVPSPDGRSFLLVLQIESISRRPFVVVLNWQETLTRR